MDLFILLELFTEMDSLVTFATISITILGAISIFIANMSRYIQAKKFGIPIRVVHQANISDSADLWVALVGTLGFGFFVPVVMLSAEVHWWLRLIIVFVAFTLALFSTKNLIKVGTKKKAEQNNKENTTAKEFPIMLVLCIALITTIAYMILHHAYYNLTVAGTNGSEGLLWSMITILAIVVQSLYVLILLTLLVLNVSTRITGNTDVMTTAIAGQNYLITMRHSSDKWILQPCDIEDYEKYLKNKDSGLYTGVKVILFEKGNLKIMELSDLPEPITYHTNSGVVEKGKMKS